MATDPSSLDWTSARRVSYLLRQSFRYEYPEPIRDLSHRLVVIPPERFGDQLRLRHQVSVDAEGVRFEDRKDRFGNVIIDVFAPRVSDAIEFVAEVMVERHAAKPNRLADGWRPGGIPPGAATPHGGGRPHPQGGRIFGGICRVGSSPGGPDQRLGVSVDDLPVRGDGRADDRGGGTRAWAGCLPGLRPRDAGPLPRLRPAVALRRRTPAGRGRQPRLGGGCATTERRHGRCHRLHIRSDTREPRRTELRDDRGWQRLLRRGANLRHLHLGRQGTPVHPQESHSHRTGFRRLGRAPRATLLSNPQLALIYLVPEMNRSRVLVVEDDARLAAMFGRVLGAEGHEVDGVGGGVEELRRANEQPFDLVVLDIMLPSLDGVSVCRRLRATAQVPVLMLTALGGTSDRVRGLDAGADDYLVKPFAYEELLARVRALLRRSAPLDPLRFADLLLEPPSRGAWRGKRSMTLTATEFELLRHFMRHPRQVLTRDQLLEAVWKGEPESDNVVAVYVGYLMQKLEEGGEPRLLDHVQI